MKKLLLNTNEVEQARIKMLIEKERESYNTLLSYAKEANLKVDDPNIIEALRQFYIAPVKEKMGDIISEAKMLDFAERGNDLSLATKLKGTIKYMEILTGKVLFEDYAKEYIYSYTSEPKAAEVATKIIEATKLMKEVGVTTGNINSAFNGFGFDVGKSSFNVYTLEYYLGVHSSQKKVPA